jgi:hypothetical protein
MSLQVDTEWESARRDPSSSANVVAGEQGGHSEFAPSPVRGASLPRPIIELANPSLAPRTGQELKEDSFGLHFGGH